MQGYTLHCGCGEVLLDIKLNEYVPQIDLGNGFKLTYDKSNIKVEINNALLKCRSCGKETSL